MPEHYPTPTAKPTVEPDLGDGAVVQNKNYKYRVYVWDNYGVITDFGLIKLQDDGSLIIELPENKLLDESNRTHVKVVNEDDGTAVKAITVNVYDVNGGEAPDITNSYGIAIIPVSSTDTTDAYGNAQVKDSEGNLYNVNVSTDEKGNIEGAVVSVADGKITVVLPDGTVIDYSDRTTVTITDRDNIPVENLPVNVKDNAGGDRTENIDANGVVVVPPRNEYQTNDGRNTGEIPVLAEIIGGFDARLVSELGAAAIYGYRDRTRCKWSEERQADIIRENLEVYMNDSRITGVFIWQLADCRVTEEGEWFATRARCHNNKGGLDEYCRPKMAYDTIKEMFGAE